jgi:SAM-dependent methyltransferase
MWLYLKKSTFFKDDNLKVLHVAPEQCFHPIFKKLKNLDYITADIVSPIADLHFDLHDIPLKENSFDVIFCNHVLEHVEDDHQCMKELYRVMKKGGWGIFQVPIDYNNKITYEDPKIISPNDREKHFWQKDHVRLYGLDYPNRLEKAGFKIDVFDPKDSLSEIDHEKLRLNSLELIFIARK